MITANQNVIIEDTTDPVIPSLSDIMDQCEVTTLTPPTTTDVCSGTITGTTSTTFPITTQGTTIVTWTFDDGNGNVITANQNVIIEDTIPPTFDSCPSNLSRNNDTGACGAIVNYNIPTATDTCGTASVTQTDATGLTSGSLFPIGTTTIEYTATDGHGNNTICSFTIIVTDVETPTITCPTNITVNADANCEAATVTLGTPTTTDNCSVATVTNDLTLPLPVGIHTVTWTVTDTAGLTATCTQTVTVQDVTAPIITCPGDITVNVDSGSCTASGVNLGMPTVMDNCGAGYTNNAPVLFPIGETIVTWTATDGAGLTDTCTQIVTVEPILVCQNITVQLDNTGHATILPEDINNSNSCASFTLSASQTSFDCSDIGINTVILTATDNASNTYSCNATVTIINLPSNADITISTPDTSVCSTSFETFTATATNFGTATPIYYWYVDGLLVQSTTSNVYTPSGLTFGTYNIQAAIGPCTPKLESNNILINVYDSPPSTPIITGPSGLVCPTTTVTLTIPADSNVESYNWSVPSELQITNNNGNEIGVYIDNTVLTQNTYTVNLTLDNPCGSSSATFEIAINGNSASINAGTDIYLCASDLDSNGNGSITMNGDADWVPLLFWGWNDNGAGGSFSENECLWNTWFGCIIPDNSETDTYNINNAQPGDVITITLETYGEETITECGAPVFDEMQIHILEETEAEITSPDTTICSGESTNIVFEGVPGQQVGFRARTITNNNIPGFLFTTAIIGADGTYTYTTPALTQSTVYHIRRVRLDPTLGLGNQCQTFYPWGAESITITVNQPATATLSYGSSSYCQNSTSIPASLSGTNNYSGGTYSSSPAGLTLNTTNGSFTPSSSTPGNYTITYTTPITTGCGSITTTTNITIQESVTANAGSVTIDPANCGSTSIALTASAFATGITGEWSVTSGPVGYNFSDINDPNAIFTGESNGTYTLEWLATNSNICGTLSDTISFTMPDNCGILIDFDGTNDHINFNNSYTLSGSFSLEVWVKPNAINGNIQTIISKRNATNLNSGYDLRLINNSISFRWNATGAIVGNGITTNRWYHIAVTYNSGFYRLYIDGVLINFTPGVLPAVNNFDFLAGAMSRTNQAPTNYYNGWLDELKIWNTALSATQIREMMNQEIEPNGGLIRGAVIPKDITGPLNWNTDLMAYYKMNQSSDISNGTLDTNSTLGVTGNLINMNTLQAETAPLPYISNNNGNWTTAGTWLNGNVQQIPNSNGVNGTPVNWNIVRTQHNVFSGNRATTVLGLLVDTNTFTINNDQVLTVNNYLNIDGVLNLEDESQLLQPMGSEVDYSGTGTLHRDQQGTTNLYNYNYWGSPVSTNGSTYQISALHDGANPVNWTGADDATATSNPITLSNRWLYLYENHTAGNYAAWNRINQTYNVPVGLGFTMKGSGVGDPITDFQNYTFVGQPNNGTIITPVTGGNEALVGNPYPSAIDADLFILENVGSITGPLYFWEHSKTNASHITADYEGGYATYSLTGAVAATTPPIGLGGIGSVGLLPRKHITVGQGFYVTGDADGGNITFNNSQRAFVKETLGMSVFLKTDEDNNNDTSGLIKRIRLNFTSPEGAVRPLLLGFTPNNEASDGVDYGYDALNTDYYPSDMSFIIEGEKYVIQAVGAFNTENMYPVTIDLGISGNIQIALTELENFNEEIAVYIYDALLGTYTQINTANYQVELDPGSHSDRYFISFQDETELNIEEEQFSNVVINYLTASSEIYINVPNGTEIKQVYLVNLLGQTVKSWNGTNAPLSRECRLPVKKISEGTYIIKVITSDNTLINKKVVVKQ
ncbi:HYR domain-containing protein [Lacinutrix himadriensis]|uniref:HYR domain-containing protein n=1 Tax=Lacinutrix himadriensis TaxID=641549 RepID=UPI0006E3B3D1|nr:HYR domain-containing protein [Lacinutrix himadriensis]